MGDNETPTLNIRIRYTGRDNETGEPVDQFMSTTITGLTADKMMSLQAALNASQDGGTNAIADAVSDSIAYFIAPMMPEGDRRTMFRHLLAGNMLVEDVFNSLNADTPAAPAPNRATRRSGGNRGRGQRNRHS